MATIHQHYTVYTIDGRIIALDNKNVNPETTAKKKPK